MQDPQNSELRQATIPTFELMEKIRDGFFKRRKTNSTLVCNLDTSHVWSVSSADRPKVLQIGLLEQDCHAYMHLDVAAEEGDLDENIMDNITTIIRTGRAAFTNATVHTEFPEDGNWNDSDEKPYENISKEMRAVGQTCLLDAVFAFVVNSDIYIRVAVSNKYPPLKSEDYKRQNVIQFVPSNFSEGLKVIQRRYISGLPHKNQSGEYVEGQTIMLLEDGTFKVSTKPSLFNDRYGALSRAVREAEGATDRARDALTTSNIAILVLPMVMNLVPVAFVADLSHKGMIIYILFTDLISTVPFLLKGVELFNLGSRRRTYATAFFAGNETIAQIELWSASCESKERFWRIGLAFIIAAILAMILGVLLEVWATRFMRRRKEHATSGAQVSGPFGRAARDWTRFGFFGSAFNEDQLELTSQDRPENETQNLLTTRKGRNSYNRNHGKQRQGGLAHSTHEKFLKPGVDDEGAIGGTEPQIDPLHSLAINGESNSSNVNNTSDLGKSPFPRKRQRRRPAVVNDGGEQEQ